MRPLNVDDLSRRAAHTISRRGSLTTLGVLVLAATVPGLALVEAKKKGKDARKRKNTKKRANDQCEKQGPPCREFAEQFCALFNPPGPPRLVCALAASACCRPLEQCQGEEFFDCLFERVQAI